jgi:hypothetical protein
MVDDHRQGNCNIILPERQDFRTLRLIFKAGYFSSSCLAEFEMQAALCEIFPIQKSKYNLLNLLDIKNFITFAEILVMPLPFGKRIEKGIRCKS